MIELLEAEPVTDTAVVSRLASRFSKLLTFTLSLDDVVLSAFLSGPGSTTMPITIFSRARLGLNPSVNTVATLTVAVVSVGVVLASVWMSRAQRRRDQEMAAAFRAGG